MAERERPPWLTPDSLDELKERLGMSWEALAERVGVSYQTLYRIRNGASAGIPVVQNRIYDEMALSGMFGSAVQGSWIAAMRAEEV